MMFVPPAKAAVHSPLWMALHAWWTATADAEHAVSIVSPGLWWNPISTHVYLVEGWGIGTCPYPCHPK
jgi:hypothetical protein